MTLDKRGARAGVVYRLIWCIFTRAVVFFEVYFFLGVGGIGSVAQSQYSNAVRILEVN